MPDAAAATDDARTIFFSVEVTRNAAMVTVAGSARRFVVGDGLECGVTANCEDTLATKTLNHANVLRVEV